MTTHAEKIVLDVIFAALQNITGDDPRDGVVKQIGILSGVMVHVCCTSGVDLPTMLKVFQDRWQEYKETFPDEAE